MSLGCPVGQRQQVGMNCGICRVSPECSMGDSDCHSSAGRVGTVAGAASDKWHLKGGRQAKPRMLLGSCCGTCSPFGAKSVPWVPGGRVSQLCGGGRKEGTPSEGRGTVWPKQPSQSQKSPLLGAHPRGCSPPQELGESWGQSHCNVRDGRALKRGKKRKKKVLRPFFSLAVVVVTHK